MANIAQDLISIQEIVKQEYLPFLNNSLNVDPSPFIEKVKKTKLTSSEGKFGTRIGIGGGFGMSAERKATPDAVPPIYKKLEYESKDGYVNLEISNKAVLLGQEDRSAMINSVMDNIEASHQAALWNVGRMLFGDGTGKLCNITASASATNTITVNSTDQLIEGLTVDIYGPSVTSNTTEPTYSSLQITAIDHSAKKVTLSSSVTMATAASSIYGFLTAQKSFGREITGLKSIFDSSVSSLYGLSKSMNPWLKPHTIDINHDISDTAITNAVSWVRDKKNVNIDMILCGTKAFEAYENYMKTNQQIIVDKHTFIGGAVGYEIMTGNKTSVVVRERFVPSTSMWGVDTSLFELKQTGWDYAAYSGNAFVLQPGTSCYRALLANYMELLCHNPGGCVELTNCNESA